MKTDIDFGREAMLYFHNRSAFYPGYSISFDELLRGIAGSDSKANIFLDGLGLAIRSIGLSTSKIKSSMENLADSGQGRIPSNQNVFFRALSDEAQNINWVAAAPEMALGVAKDVAKGVAAGGESVITTLKSLNVVLPLVIVGGVIFVLVQKFKKAA